MSDDLEKSLRDAFNEIGDEGISSLVAAFYRRVPSDPLLGPMYPPHELAEAEKRLRDFLRFRFGGRNDYIENRGHPRLRMRHAHFAITPAAREHWVALMTAAFEECQFSKSVAAPLQRFLVSTATFLVNQPQ